MSSIHRVIIFGVFHFCKTIGVLVKNLPTSQLPAYSIFLDKYGLYYLPAKTQVSVFDPTGFIAQLGSEELGNPVRTIGNPLGTNLLYPVEIAWTGGYAYILDSGAYLKGLCESIKFRI